MVHWIGNSEQWKSRGMLVKALRMDGHPAFQYLTGNETYDPIDVELAFEDCS